MINLINFVSFAFQLVVLAVVLGVAGFGVRTLLTRVSDARRQSEMNAQGRIAAAKSRAAARSSVHA